jgi:hypothetical protein
MYLKLTINDKYKNGILVNISRLIASFLMGPKFSESENV